MENFFYRVEEKDTVLSISERFSVPPTKIIKANNLRCEVCEGDLLYIEKASGCLYRVKPFETAFSVAQKFGTTEQKILQDNGVEYLFYGLIISV